jgi:hypothetical protein
VITLSWMGNSQKNDGGGTTVSEIGIVLISEVSGNHNVTAGISVIHIEAAIRIVGRIKGHAEEAPLTAGRDQIAPAAADIQESGSHTFCREVEDLDSSSLFNDEETSGVSRNGGHEDRGRER